MYEAWICSLVPGVGALNPLVLMTLHDIHIPICVFLVRTNLESWESQRLCRLP